MIHHPPATSCSISPAPQTAIIPSPRIIPPSANPRNVMMDAEVQTDQLLVLKVPCHCDSKPRDRSRSRQDNNQRSGGEDRPNTQMSMIAVKSQSTSNSNTPVVRPLWGAHQSTAKYKVAIWQRFENCIVLIGWFYHVTMTSSSANQSETRFCLFPFKKKHFHRS